MMRHTFNFHFLIQSSMNYQYSSQKTLLFFKRFISCRHPQSVTKKGKRIMDTRKSNSRKTVSISSQLYDELREFCDRMEIPFLDFVEESLETATRRYEMEELLNNHAKIKAKMKNQQQQAYLDGFEKGVLASFTAISGQTAISQRITPQTVRNRPRYQMVTGEQMKLFEFK